MKKYKLKKDIAGLKAGAVFEHRDYDDKYPDRGNAGTGVMILSWSDGNCQQMWCGETFIFPGQLADDKEWFELLVDEKKEISSGNEEKSCLEHSNANGCPPNCFYLKKEKETERCTKCNNFFENHHKRYSTSDGVYHGRCYGKLQKKVSGGMICFPNCPHCLGGDMSKAKNRSRYWNDLVNILDRQFPKGKCVERGRALIVLAYTELLMQGYKFNNNGEPTGE